MKRAGFDLYYSQPQGSQSKYFVSTSKDVLGTLHKNLFSAVTITFYVFELFYRDSCFKGLCIEKFNAIAGELQSKFTTSEKTHMQCDANIKMCLLM